MPKADRMSEGGNMPLTLTPTPTTTTSPDPALIIGLSLSFARQGRGGSATVPAPLLHDLTGLSQAGDPTAILVSQWIAGRATRTGERR